MTPKEEVLSLLRLALNNEWTRQVTAHDQQRHLLNELEALWSEVKQDPQDLEVARNKLRDQRLETKQTYELAWDILSRLDHEGILAGLIPD
jgi:hypothetical protein